MQKKSLGCAVLSILFSLAAFSACHTPRAGNHTPPQNELSSQHVPVPLPIFPDEESLPSDEKISQFDDSSDQPKEPLSPNVWDLSDVDVSKIDPSKKLIAFTFDDAPARHLENILAVFASFNESNPDCTASATLFLNGYRFDSQTPTLLTTALALGLELGNHTHSHTDLTTLSLTEMTEEISRVDGILSQFDERERHLFRPPYGKITDEQKNALQTPIVNWTIDTLDWTGLDEESIYQSVMQNKFSGAIVLMHDGHKHTVQALKRLLPDLKAEGYQVVNVSQMSKMHDCPLYKSKEYIRIRKR